jgi:CheY-like chemotaxis protein
MTAMIETGKNRVLIAEDDPDNGYLLQFMLMREGIAAELVEDGFKALEFLERVTDIGLPGKSGIELITEIREREAAGGSRRAPQIIAWSASGIELLRRAEKAGAVRGFKKDELTGIVNKVKELLQRLTPGGLQLAGALS